MSNCKIFQCFEWCTPLPSKDQSRKSPVLLLDGNEWFLRFFLLEDNYSTSYYELYLELKNKHRDIKPCSVNFQVGFKNEQALSLGKKELTISENLEIWYINANTLNSKLPPDYMDGNWIKFLLHFQCYVAESVVKINETREESVQTPPYIDTRFLLEDVSKDLSTLFDEGSNHDVEFICGDETIKVHKNIICCRSKVFASMLQSDMAEGKTGQVKISDMESSLFRHFLRYMYTGVLTELTVDSALKFYEAADKYAMDPLKKQCASFLIDNLSLETACEVLIISDRHNDLEFKKNVIGYIIKEKVPKLIGEKWDDFCKENQALAIEILNFFYKQAS